jgi:hypothetical protein
LVESFPVPGSEPAFGWEADVVPVSPEVRPLALSSLGGFVPPHAATVSQVTTRSATIRVDRMGVLDRLRSIAEV